MRSKMRWALAAAIVAVCSLGYLAVAGDAGEVTVTGKIVCAKCSLHKADAKECQNVLVAQKDGGDVEYYVVKNDVAEAFGHACKGEKAVVATGMVAEKDGKTWITASKMEAPKEG